jgi:hypothetical protein
MRVLKLTLGFLMFFEIPTTTTTYHHLCLCEPNATLIHHGAVCDALFGVRHYRRPQVSFLLEVYGQLEEPDGLAGAHTS